MNAKDAASTRGTRRGILVAGLALVLTAGACTVSLKPAGDIPTARASGTHTISRAPECDRYTTLCDQMFEELRDLRMAMPLGLPVGETRLTLSGDGRFILTDTTVDEQTPPDSARQALTFILRSGGWQKKRQSQGRPLWHGTGEREGWLVALDIVPATDGARLSIALYAPTEGTVREP
ncbi:MAG TPA: hypothetical protein VGB52_08115 [Actinomycetota bacterium]